MLAGYDCSRNTSTCIVGGSGFSPSSLVQVPVCESLYRSVLNETTFQLLLFLALKLLIFRLLFLYILAYLSFTLHDGNRIPQQTSDQQTSEL